MNVRAGGSAAAVGESGPTRVRRVAARQVRPVPTGPGRSAARARRPVPAGVLAGRRSVSSGRPAPGRPVAGWARGERCRAPGAGGPAGGWRAIATVLLVALASAVVVAGLGTLADVARAARVPTATTPVVVRADESLWQLARRTAPSAEPAAVVGRIVELNDLGSPSARPGQVVVSPVG